MKSKIEICKFHSFEHKGIEEYLEIQALKGWKLTGIYGGYIKFKKIEPQKLKYSVEVVDGVTFFNGKNSDIALNFREYCIEADWKFVCEWAEFQIFCHEDDKDIVPINTDEELKFKKIIKSSTKSIFWMAVLAIILAFNVVSGFFIYMNPYTLTSNMNVILMILILGIWIALIVDIGRYIKFIFKGRKSLKLNEPVIYSTYKSLRLKKRIDTVYVILAIIGLVLGVVESGEIVIGVLIIIGLGSFTIYKVWNCTGNIDAKRKKNILITSYIGITIIMILSLVGFIFFGINYKENKSVVATISGEDFGIHVNNDEIYKTEESGVLASYTVYSDNVVNYDEFESNYKWVNSYYFNRKIKQVEEYGEDIIKLNTANNTDYEIYNVKNRNLYIVKLPNEVIEITVYEEGLSEETILKTIYEKVIR